MIITGLVRASCNFEVKTLRILSTKYAKEYHVTLRTKGACCRKRD